MNTPRTLKNIVAGTLPSGGVAVAGVGLAAGCAHAENWCPPNGRLRARVENCLHEQPVILRNSGLWRSSAAELALFAGGSVWQPGRDLRPRRLGRQLGLSRVGRRRSDSGLRQRRADTGHGRSSMAPRGQRPLLPPAQRGRRNRTRPPGCHGRAVPPTYRRTRSAVDVHRRRGPCQSTNAGRDSGHRNRRRRRVTRVTTPAELGRTANTARPADVALEQHVALRLGQAAPNAIGLADP